MRLWDNFVSATSVLAAWSAILVLPAPVIAQSYASSPAVSYVNTLAEQRADPHIFKHTDGWYYFTATVPAFDRIVLRRAQSIQALASAAETTIWRRKASGVGSNQVWAPEIRKFLPLSPHCYFHCCAYSRIVMQTLSTTNGTFT